MKFRTTLILFFAALLVGGVIVGVERYLPSTLELRELRRGPAQFVPEEIDEIQISMVGAPEIQLDRRDGVWWVAKPIDDLADPEKVGVLISELAKIEWVEKVQRAEFDDEAWALTGLESPRMKVALRRAGEVQMSCHLGLEAVLEDSVYLKLPAGNGRSEAAYYVARTGVPALLQSSGTDWRDSKLIRIPIETIARVSLSQESGQIEVARSASNSPWSLVKPLATRGDTERINELVATLLNLGVTEAAEAGMGEGDLVLNDPLKVGIVAKGLPAPVEITLKKPAPDSNTTTATVTGRKPVFTISSPELARLWASPNDLRDPMLAQVNENELAAMTLSSHAFPDVELRRENQSWLLKRQGEWVPANGDRLGKLFHALNEHRIQEFASDSASNLEAFGLDKPFLRLSWTINGEDKAETLQFGHSEDRTGFFAKYDGEPFVYRIGASLLPSIPGDAMKWKGLGVMRFTQFSLRGITIALGAQPPIVLRHDPTTADWTGNRAGRDITPMIDRVRADALASKLARLTAEDWVGDRTAAYEALKESWLTIVVYLGEPGTAEGPETTTTLRFSPTVKDQPTTFFYGQVDGDLDVFYISRAMLLEVLESVLKPESNGSER